MNSRLMPEQPPQIGGWLLRLFVLDGEADLIGDLSEEYLQIASQSGVSVARRWYWRQTLKSLPYLVISAFRTSPWNTAAAIAAGFEFRRFAGRQIEPAIFSVIDRWQIAENHFGVYQFLASTGIDIGHLITFLMVGFLVALIARRSEIAPAGALGLIYAAMAVLGSIFYVVRTHDFTYLLRLSWYFSDAFTIVMGAVIVRTLRSDPVRMARQ